MEADARTYAAHPAMLATPHATSTSGMDDGSAGAAARTVSYAEYERVVANEAALGENVETLKAVALHLAGQLQEANEALQLLERCSVKPPPPTRSEKGTSSGSKTATASPSPAASPAPFDAERRAQQELLERKDAVIDALRQQLHDQESRFHATLDEVVREKNAVIEGLALDLDDARRALRRRR